MRPAVGPTKAVFNFRSLMFETNHNDRYLPDGSYEDWPVRDLQVVGENV